MSFSTVDSLTLESSVPLVLVIDRSSLILVWLVYPDGGFWILMEPVGEDTVVVSGVTDE